MITFVFTCALQCFKNLLQLSHKPFSTFGTHCLFHLSSEQLPIRLLDITGYMEDGTVTLIAVLTPCLLVTIVIAAILYHAFYRHWTNRFHRLGHGAREASEQQRQQQEQDGSNNNNENVDVEALRCQGDPSLVFSHSRTAGP